MNEIETIKVKLENLKPFSGVLYNENNVATRIEGNPFYVPKDYLPKIKSSAETESAEAADEDAESAES